jgi:stage IV sporulation protein B
MKKRIWKLLCCLLLMLGATLPTEALPVSTSPLEKEFVPAMSSQPTDAESLPTASLCTVPTYTVDVSPTLAADTLRSVTVCVGGMPFGVKFFTEGVTVVGFNDIDTKNGSINPAARAGLRQKDVILTVNGTPLSGAADLNDRIEASQGTPLKLTCRRAGKEFEALLTPAWCDAEARYKTGIWVRDSGAGIGTVTFILPDTGAFAGLGHGICDAETGTLVPMKRGSVSNVTISAVVKGKAGDPGELKGYFNAGKTGALLGNSACGVWGMFTTLPSKDTPTMQLGLRDEIQEGDAYILCTLESNKIEKYDVRISNIRRESTGSKCYTVTVTDPDLIASTGGIVQGMSGSPIIQNGKLVGAVTHVLINDPTTGYGIFIENMLNAAQMPMAKAS